MKRLYEELFFKQISTSSRQDNRTVIFTIPNEYEPLYGDIVEMIISEPNTFGGATYYAKLVVFKDGADIYLGVLDGRLKGDDGKIYPLVAANYSNIDGKKSIYLFADDGVNVLFNEQENLVNMIVHRPRAEIELYVA